MQSQTDAILDHLKCGKSITHREAEHLFGCTRIAARVNDLRRAGYDIRTNMERHNKGRHARYWLPSEQHHNFVLMWDER